MKKVGRMKKIVLMIIFFSLCYGFWDAPHMIIAQIAKENIEEGKMEKIEDLLKEVEKAA